MTGRAAIPRSVEAASGVVVLVRGLGVRLHGSVANIVFADNAVVLELELTTGAVTTLRYGDDGPRNKYARETFERHAVGIGMRVAGCR